MTRHLSEIWTFIRRHWLHAGLSVPGIFLVTLIHESAHALAAIQQGATVDEFVWLPTYGHWGYVSYSFPLGQPHSVAWIGLAPYLLWTGLAILVMALTFRSRPWGFTGASFLYYWLFFVPLADIGNTAFPYLRGRENDFSQVWGSPTSIATLLISLAAALALWIGYGVQRRLYREAALRPVAYSMLSVTGVLLLNCIV